MRMPRAATLLGALLFAASAVTALAADEQHQAVRGVRATWSMINSELKIEVLLANGDRVRRTFSGEEAQRITSILELASRERASLYADLRGKEIVALTLETGQPIPYEEPRTP